MKIYEILNRESIVVSPDLYEKLVESSLWEQNFILSDSVGRVTAEQVCESLVVQIEIVKENNVEYLWEGVSSLSKIPSNSILHVLFIESSLWKGRLYVTHVGELVCFAFSKGGRRQMITPPNWDGSLKMLEEYNESIDK